jgi:hypothetical protein
MTAQDFIRALKSGPYAWPGGYPLCAVFSDGALCCYKCAKENALHIARAIRDDERDGWKAIAVGVKWENDPESGPDYCEQCGDEIEVAYPEDK